MEAVQTHEPWNKGKLVGQKAPLKLKDIWAIRIHLQLDQRIRERRYSISPSTAIFIRAWPLSYFLTMNARRRTMLIEPPNDRTERRGRPSASTLATDVARPRSLQ